MQIIRINSKSYKIILSREEICKEDDFGHLSKALIHKILDKTQELYGCDFDSGSIDADFFESKDGGGELFISQGCNRDDNTYLFKTDNFEVLVSLCKRLMYNLPPGITSSLYKDKNGYCLLFQLCSASCFFLSTIKEYGTALKISTFQKWLLEEHSKLILSGCAIKKLSSL